MVIKKDFIQKRQVIKFLLYKKYFFVLKLKIKIKKLFPSRIINSLFEDAKIEPPGNLSLYINRLKERKFIQIPSKYGDKNRYAELTEEGRQHLEEKSTSL